MTDIVIVIPATGNTISKLSNDIMEMIEDATQEEKQALRQKISLLATKIK